MFSRASVYIIYCFCFPELLFTFAGRDFDPGSVQVQLGTANKINQYDQKLGAQKFSEKELRGIPREGRPRESAWNVNQHWGGCELKSVRNPDGSISLIPLPPSKEKVLQNMREGKLPAGEPQRDAFAASWHALHDGSVDGERFHEVSADSYKQLLVDVRNENQDLRIFALPNSRHPHTAQEQNIPLLTAQRHFKDGTPSHMLALMHDDGSRKFQLVDPAAPPGHKQRQHDEHQDGKSKEGPHRIVGDHEHRNNLSGVDRVHAYYRALDANMKAEDAHKKCTDEHWIQESRDKMAEAAQNSEKWNAKFDDQHSDFHKIGTESPLPKPDQQQEPIKNPQQENQSNKPGDDVQSKEKAAQDQKRILKDLTEELQKMRNKVEDRKKQECDEVSAH